MKKGRDGKKALYSRLLLQERRTLEGHAISSEGMYLFGGEEGLNRWATGTG